MTMREHAISGTLPTEGRRTGYGYVRLPAGDAPRKGHVTVNFTLDELATLRRLGNAKGQSASMLVYALVKKHLTSL